MEFPLLTAVEVSNEVFEKVGHSSFVPYEIAETGLTGLFGWEKGVVDQFTNVEEKVIGPVVAMQMDAAKQFRRDANGSNRAKNLELLMQELLGLTVQIPVLRKKCEGGFDDAVVEDVVTQFVEFTNHASLPPGLPRHAGGEIETPLEGSCFFAVGEIVPVESTSKKVLGPIGENPCKKFIEGMTLVGSHIHFFAFRKLVPGIAEEVVDVLDGDCAGHRS